MADDNAAAAAAREATNVRKLNQMINFIDCSKDLNDSGKEACREGVDKTMIESGVVVMIDELFGDSAPPDVMTARIDRRETIDRIAAARGPAPRAPAPKASRDVLNQQRDGAKNAIDAIFQRLTDVGNEYKIIGDDKPKMNTIISANATISLYLNDLN